MHKYEVSSTTFKKQDIVYSGKNCDVREILRYLIGCLEDNELEKTDLSWKPQIDVLIFVFLFPESLGSKRICSTFPRDEIEIF